MKTQFLFIALCLFFGASALQGQTVKLAGKAYPFPVVPGTEAWKQLASHEEMLRATEVPDSILQKMSTDDVLATAMSYPLKWDALAFDNPIIGVNTVAARSAIFKELLSRPDVSEKIVSFYQTLDPDSPRPEWAPEESGLFSLTFLFVESLLAQPQVVGSLNTEQSISLLKQILGNHVKMQVRSDLYGAMSHAIPAFLAGKILLQNNSSAEALAQPETAEFLKGRFTRPSDTVTNSIFSATNQFLVTNKK